MPPTFGLQRTHLTGSTQLSKLNTRVRFPSSAPHIRCLTAYRVAKAGALKAILDRRLTVALSHAHRSPLGTNRPTCAFCGRVSAWRGTVPLTGIERGRGGWMTAEAIVMNKSAVALAADSAVTIADADRSYKTFDTANKLFELIKGSNIGVMVYSDADLNGTPWETIIKTYRRDNPTFTASHVEDYFDHFLTFLESNSRVMRAEDEWLAVSSIVTSQLNILRKNIFDRVEDYVTAGGRVVKRRLHEVVNDVCDRWQKHIEESADIHSRSEFSDQDIRRAYSDLVKHITEARLSTLGLESRDIRRISQLALVCLKKEVDRKPYSGLVLAGFGKHDYFPKQIGTKISARLSGHLMMREPDMAEISVTSDRNGYFATFAQDGPAQGWVNGINAEVRDVIGNHWLNWVSRSLPRKLGRALQSDGRLTPEQIKIAASPMLSLAREQLSDFLNHMDDYEDENFRAPMLASISLLPKEELGLLAESLVNITSLKQRMSIFQANTVGGAIDVALISPGDGFVWLKRKHYFDTEFNPTWTLTHHARIDAMSEGIK
jgi:hypothetical protein